MKKLNNKGISLVTLTIAVMIILIITGTLIYNSTNGREIRNLKNMYNDIEVLNSKVSEWYTTYGDLPAGEVYNNPTKISDIETAGQLGSNDNEVYYKIDINVLQNLNLNYGIQKTTDDIYIINEQSHKIYYAKGIRSGDVTYYTNEITNQEIEISYPALYYARQAMPTGARILEGTNEETGIVMIDSNENEWVWVEVPATVFASAQNSTDYTNIKADLITYASDYREGSIGQGRYWQDEWYNGCGLTQAQYEETYNKMLASVYTNKGFYISRYEIGDKESTISNTTRTSSTGVSNTPVSKVDQIPYNFVTCSGAQGLASSMKTGTKTSSLLFGIQWDLTCKFLEENASWPSGQDAIYYLKTNSTSWGNYGNQSLTLSRGKYNIDPRSSSNTWKVYNVNTPNYVISSQTSNNPSYSPLLTTGASEKINKMNIYDFAGNVWEWTLEHVEGNTIVPQTFRGSSFLSSTIACASREKNTDVTSAWYLGFRAALY